MDVWLPPELRRTHEFFGADVVPTTIREHAFVLVYASKMDRNV